MGKERAKPFLKWAGGKTQLLDQYAKFYPPGLVSGEIKKYFEPFLGGGAVFFDIAQKYPIIKAFLYDINKEVILVYKVVKNNVDELIGHLLKIQEKFQTCKGKKRREYYYYIREKYNKRRKEINYNQYCTNWVNRASQMIFLNKTCFNGLFRLNRSGEFNVPFGGYKNPRILDAENLRNVSRVLQIAELHAADFASPNGQVTADSFVYYDPPYRPISATSGFTTYSSFEFGDKEQIRLAKVFYQITDKGAKAMLSNSDPKNININDNFFDKLYSGFNINRVKAKRMINSVAKKRGHINEIIITNY